MFGNTPLSFCLFFYIFLFSIPSTLTLLCYDCDDCTNITSCTCNRIYESDVKDSYCTLLRESLSDGIYVEMSHASTTSTPYEIYDPYYVSVDERIAYDNNTESWLSISEQVTYGCQTDQCNRAQLASYLPSNGLSSMLPSDWLNENLQRKADQNTSSCRSCDDEICGDSTVPFNMSQCPPKDCQGSCIMIETFNKAETNELCYQSLCSDDTALGPNVGQPQINITGIYYLNKKRFEIVQIQVQCNGADCTHLELFNDIKEKLQINLDNIKAFLPTNHVNSMYSTSIIFFIVIILQILIFY